MIILFLVGSAAIEVLTQLRFIILKRRNLQVMTPV
jgi:hypothetical protein